MGLYIDSDDVVHAHGRIKNDIRNTPLIASTTLSNLAGCTTRFKLENLQMTGSFKERGALNKLLDLTDVQRQKGIIAASAGNHAQALAYHGKRLGIPVKIVMPKYSPIVKVTSTEHWGAEVILAGDTFDDAFAESVNIAERENLTYIHPFNDPLVVAGQGTVALEIIESRNSPIDAIIVPVGGGGLIAGMATYIKSVSPATLIIGVEEASCAAMYQALQQGQPILVPAAPVIADGIAVREVSADNLKVINALVDEVVSVTSDEISNAIMLMLEIEKLVVEGAGATPLAALINHRLPQLRGKNVVSIVSGGNIDVNLLSRVIDKGLSFDGRVSKLETTIVDKPGCLEQLLTVFRKSGANVLEVNHHRFSLSTPIGHISVSVTIETRGKEHLGRIVDSLTDHGYSV